MEQANVGSLPHAVFGLTVSRSRERAARMFRLLGVHPGPDITVPAAASLTALSRADADLALAELCDQRLVTEHLPGRYVRNGASHGCPADATRAADAEREVAVHRLLDHYLHTARAAACVLRPGMTPFLLDRPLPGVLPEEIGGAAEAEEWFETERNVLFAAIDEAAEGGYRPHAWALPWAAGSFFRDTVCQRRLAAAQLSALGVAASHRDLAGRALASLHLGQLRSAFGETADACRHLEDAIELYRARNDRDGEISAIDTLARQLISLGLTPLLTPADQRSR